MSQTYSQARPLRVAVIGSGPAGFFAAEAILKAATPAQVDVIERLPAPYGLVRYGVSPDHMRIRNVQRMLDRIAGMAGFRFMGNVEVDRDVSVAELRRYYDAVVFANGTPGDKRLEIPGEDLRGVVNATAFAAWYNGHPNHPDCPVRLDCTDVAVIGVGNVAVDVARMLLRAPEEFAGTDAPARVVATLAESRVRTVHLIARRGPGQAAFSPKELQELTELANADCVIDPADLALNPETEQELQDPSKVQNKRIVETMRQHAPKPLPGKPRRLILRWLQSPLRIEGEGQVQRIILGRNRLEGPAGAQRAVPTGEEVSLDCGLLLRGIGHRGVPLQGVPFEPRTGLYRNAGGRLLDESGAPLPGLYAVGWVRRGPVGVIGATKLDANEVIANLQADLAAGALPACPEPAAAAIDALLAGRGVRVVSFADWQRLEQLEAARAADSDRVSERFTSIADMLAALDGGGG